MTQRPDASEEDQILTGEYVLGVLPASERRAFEARLAQELQLRDLVDAWEQDLAALADDVAPVDPPARLRAAIEQRLFAGPRSQHSGLWSNLAFWRVTGLAALGALVAVAFLGFVTPQKTVGPSYVSQLSADGGAMQLSALYDPSASVLRVTRVAGKAPEGRVLELWLIEDGQAPRSLGVLEDAEASTRIPLPERLIAKLDGARLAVSHEPPGGAPAGAPTGEILAIGAITRL
ncbi:MAG: anti-sigma factor [Brevirhabdus sp.]